MTEDRRSELTGDIADAIALAFAENEVVSSVLSTSQINHQARMLAQELAKVVATQESNLRDECCKLSQTMFAITRGIARKDGN